MTDDQLLTEWRNAKSNLAEMRIRLEDGERNVTNLRNGVNEAMKREDAAWAALLALRSEVTR